VSVSNFKNIEEIFSIGQCLNRSHAPEFYETEGVEKNRLGRSGQKVVILQKSTI
jgi:hypothetical protein